MLNPAVAKTRSRVAVAHRQGDPQAIEDARREHIEAKLAAYIKAQVDTWPPLTEEQRTRLAALLQGGGADV